MGLPRSARLAQRRDIEAVRRAGRRGSGASGTLWALAGTGASSRLCVICPRRVGTAVARNRARRRLQAVLWAAVARLQGTWDIVWRAEAQVVTAPAKLLAGEVARMLERAGVKEPAGDGAQP